MSNLYNPTKEEVREFLDLAEGNESGIYPDPYLLPTHGLGIRLDDKNDAFFHLEKKPLSLLKFKKSGF